MSRGKHLSLAEARKSEQLDRCAKEHPSVRDHEKVQREKQSGPLAVVEPPITVDDTLSADLTDGRTIAVPLAWYPRLFHAAPAVRGNWRLVGGGEGIHWLDLDGDVSVAALLMGKRTVESVTSLRNWQAARS